MTRCHHNKRGTYSGTPLLISNSNKLNEETCGLSHPTEYQPLKSKVAALFIAQMADFRQIETSNNTCDHGRCIQV